MAANAEWAPAVASVTELATLGAAVAWAVADRYAGRAAAASAAGNAEAADLLRALAAAQQADGVDISPREGGPVLSPAGGDLAVPALAATLDELSDDDAYTLTSYRVLAVAVRHDQRMFAFYAYVAAYAEDGAVRQLAETLAREQLDRAGGHRRERRLAWRRLPERWRKPLPRSGDEVRALAATIEGEMAAGQRTLADRADREGDPATAEVLRGIAAEATTLVPDGLPSPVGADVTMPPTADSFELLRNVLRDLECAHTFYTRVAEGRADEEVMLAAQRWAASSVRRSQKVRGQLSALRRVPGS